MLFNYARSVLLAVALLISATVSYSFVIAGDKSETAPSKMSGTFLVYTIDGSNDVKALVDLASFDDLDRFQAVESVVRRLKPPTQRIRIDDFA